MGLDWPVQGTGTDIDRKKQQYNTRQIWTRRIVFLAGGIQEPIWLWNLCVGERGRSARDKWSHRGKVKVGLLCYVRQTLYEYMLHYEYACVCWWWWLQISVDKDEIPLLSGQYVLGYYSTNMQSIIGLSASFQVSVPSVVILYDTVCQYLIICWLGIGLCRLCSKTSVHKS